MIDRRRLMLSAAGVGLAATLPAAAFAQTPSEADARLDALLSGWFYDDLERRPTQATSLGLDKGERAHLAGELGDLSLEAARSDRDRAAVRWAQLKDWPTDGLSDASKVSLAVARFQAESAAIEASLPVLGSPYVVAQNTGSYFQVPDFMANQHRLETPADAEAFLSRLKAFAVNVDQENARIRADAGEGVMLPAVIMDKTLTQLRALRDMPAADMAMIQTLTRKTGEKDITGDWFNRAAVIVDEQVKPALGRQIELFESQRPSASEDVGVWRFPNGEALYNLGLRRSTTTTYTGAEIHEIGLKQVASIQAEIAAILQTLGMTEGTVGERVNALGKDPQHLFPNTEEGKVALIAALNEMVAAVTPRLPDVFSTLPKAPVEIRRVPPSIEIGAPGGYYQAASLDGSRPGAYYINLRDTANRPKWSLPTLTYHEAVPGHHFQISVAREAGSLPIYRRTGGFSAYSEGWALYSERVAADDLNMYEGDPLGRIGYLQAYLFRAVRLVVDTGLHDKRWSRQRAIDYMIAEAATPANAAQSEVDRYVVWPGQACSYKLGQTVIEDIRRKVEARGGFDIKAFHDKVLLNGAVPLSVLEAQFA
ncbi:DUF885 domain-containing protein [Brevundimonas goettingensis]|uniref:DUF885 domain-containing protein n=1 Tax=Brevundimonas goettingensis TaxID=2774190 RepID=A0A975GUI1_9CAUL|nr:DUF885 family protein [Brevundimonas goettingensis]QTC90117.1 DUF885 domain-containing protein [Brevundimonas goettingensis]